MTDTTVSIGKYRIIEEIGHGGFATVYRALDTTLDREVALKVLDPALTRDPNFISRFQQEARITARLFHPNIAALFEVGQADGRYFIAMQFASGRNLRECARERGLLSLDQIALVIQQVGAALDYAHSRGAIHRDVKPGNIIFDETSEHVMLTDFGIVKALEATTVQTTGGSVLGTPAYASPEQAESKPLDGRSDLYSLGVVAYELCAGQVPFVADTTPSLFYKIVHEAPAVPSKVNPRMTAMLEQVLLKAIAKSPDQRYATGREFAQAFSAAVEQAKGDLLQSLSARARSALAAGDFDAAQASLGQALAIQASHQETLTLLKEVRQKQEAARRYAQLVQLVNQARAQAVELKQTDPDLADKDGVLGLLALQAKSGHVQETPSAAPAAKRTLSRPQVALGLVLLVGSVIALIVGLTVTKGIWIQSVSEDDLPLVYILIRGNLLIGAGLGGALGSLLIMAFSVRKAP